MQSGLGSGTSGQGGALLLKVLFGKICEEVKDEPADVEKWQTRVNKNEQTVYFKLYPAITGYVQKLERRDSDWGGFFDITLTRERIPVVGEIPWRLSISENSAEMSSILTRIEGVDFDKPLEIKPYSFKDEATDKERRGLTLKQFDENAGKVVILKNLYDKDNPIIKEFPQPFINKTGRNKGKWNFEAYEDFQYTRLDDVIEKVSVLAAQRGSIEAQQAPEQQTAEKAQKDVELNQQQTEAPDDLPF